MRGPLVAFLICILFAAACRDRKIDPQEAVIKTDDSVLIGFNQRILQDPDNPDLYHQRAKYLFIKQQPDAALSDMRRVMLIDSSKAEYHLTLAEIYFVKGQGNNVKRAYEKALALDPGNEEAMMKLAELYLYVQNYKDSFRMLDQVLRKNVNNPKAYFIKGIAFKETGDTAKAISSFQTTIEQDPDHFKAYVELGVLLTAKKDPLALDYLNNALALDSNSIEALYARGFYAQENGMYDLAIKSYEKILQVNPGQKEAYYNLGYIHSEHLNKYNESIAYYNKALSVDPRYVEAYYQRGYTYERMNKSDLAYADYRQCIAIHPNFELAVQGLNRLSRS